MKTLYLDCGMGAAGDMLAGALYDLLSEEQRAEFQNIAAAFSAVGLNVRCAAAEKCGIRGIHFAVEYMNTDADEYAACINEHEHLHEHEHCHEHEHEHEHCHEHEHNHEHEHLHEHEHCHEHEHEHEHEHCHEHEHSHEHEHHHSHSGLHEIEHIIRALPVSDAVKEHSLAVYKLIAEAESHAHGVPVELVHFHEVGALDAVADIVSCCALIEMLAPERIAASPVRTGSGHVHCAHGILPIPAPATAFILHGVPVYAGDIKGELCTPTGAALLKHFVHDFTAMPLMTILSQGYGMGKRDYPAANCVRALFGESPSEESADEIIELRCNIDDMTGEEIGFAFDKLLNAGAADVYTVPTGMKKNRPGIMLCVLCDAEKRSEIIRILFKHTSTLGVRECRMPRYILQRETQTAKFEDGTIRLKTAQGFGVKRSKFEYADIAALAERRAITLADAEKIAETAFKEFSE